MKKPGTTMDTGLWLRSSCKSAFELGEAIAQIFDGQQISVFRRMKNRIKGVDCIIEQSADFDPRVWMAGPTGALRIGSQYIANKTGKFLTGIEFSNSVQDIRQIYTPITSKLQKQSGIGIAACCGKLAGVLFRAWAGMSKHYHLQFLAWQEELNQRLGSMLPARGR